MSILAAASTSRNRVNDRLYEIKAVSLMTFGLGILGLDRFIINPLFPLIQKDLGLNYQDLGLISAVLALTWGGASIFTGQIADRLGHKPVLVASAIAFSLLVASTGLATGLATLLILRAVMGLAEGAFLPASIVATVEASKPSRVGLNVGIQQMAQPLFGLGLGPVIAVRLLHVVPSWHWVFAAAALPGLLVAALIALAIRHDPPHSPADHTTEKSVSFLHALGNRNVVFNMIGMCCYLTATIILASFMPSYLTDHLKLSLGEMSGVLAAQGVGSFVGMLSLPALSDRIGRKPVMIAALALCFVALWILMQTGANIPVLFATLFLITAMIAGTIAITVGPLTNASVPPAIAATATGLVVGAGEIFGGALAPAIAGALADQMGIAIILHIAIIAVGLAVLVVSFGVREPQK